MNWAYGVTTVPSRFGELLPRTLASLAAAGFPNPRLFIDGAGQLPDSFRQYEITQHVPPLRTAGNWIIAAYELYLRNPTAERYAIFQDDFVTYKNLRQYLEACKYPERGYWNLYLFPENESAGESGWYLSNQLGRGAVALVFDNQALRYVIGSQYMVDRALDARRGHKSVDGGIVTALRMLRNGAERVVYKEYVHQPSLVQHIGALSSMGNRPHAQARTFRGEAFDALELLSNPVDPVSS